MSAEIIRAIRKIATHPQLSLENLNDRDREVLLQNRLIAHDFVNDGTGKMVFDLEVTTAGGAMVWFAIREIRLQHQLKETEEKTQETA